MKFYLILITLLISFFMNGCSSDSSSSDVKGIAKVVIAPKSVLLTNPNQSKMLSATAYDANGNILDKNISWTSSHSDIVAIAVDGNASAQGIIGSTTITAEVDGVKSAQVMVLVTELVGGAITVDDNQVVGNIDLVDTNATLEIGTQYKVTLQNIAIPQSGDILVGLGEIPIAGQVISASQNSTDVNVILEIVPLNQIFSQLKIDENTTLTPADFLISDDFANSYSVVSTSDGKIVFDKKSAGLQRALLSNEFDLGPFECKTDSSINLLTLSIPETIQFTPHMTRTFIFDGSLQKASITGSLASEFKLGINLTSSLDNVFSCTSEVAKVEFRIAGPFYFAIPIGIGFDLNGQVQLAQLGIEESFKIDQSLEFGVACTGGDCQKINTYNMQAGSLETKYTIPSTTVANNIHLKPEFTAYSYTQLLAGINIFFDIRAEFELVVAKLGLVQAGDFGNIPGQIEDINYVSEYKLSSYTKLQPGADLGNMPIFGPYNFIPPLQEQIVTDLVTSPKALSATASKNQYYIADTVTFKVELDPNTVDYSFLGYNVDKISIYRRVPEGQGDFEYNWLFDMPAVDGQTQFERDWVFTEDGSIDDNYFAFIETKWLPTFGEFGILELAPIVVEPEDYTTTRECTEGGVTDRWSWTYIADENKTIEDHNGAITTYVTSEQNLTATKYIHTTQITHPDNTVTYKNETYDTALPIINPIPGYVSFPDYVLNKGYETIPKYLLANGSETYTYNNGTIKKEFVSAPDQPVEYLYNSSNNVYRRISYYGSSGIKTTDYSYNTHNDITYQHSSNNTDSDQRTTTASYGYDGSGNITSINSIYNRTCDTTEVGCSYDSSDKYDISCSYDTHNNLTSELVTYTEATSDGYAQTYHGTRIINYTYDSLGNILSKIRSEGGDGEVFSTYDVDEAYTYMVGTKHMTQSSVTKVWDNDNSTTSTKDCSYSDSRW